jgi:radical SAM superfamily enzyme YgiQ (UPF0313 family)
MSFKVLMVYPMLGFSGVFVRHAPLSLIYASTDLIKNNISVEILDLRLHQEKWKQALKNALIPDIRVVGISVMSGKPIKSAMEIGRYVKSIMPDAKVVWGGPHATFHPEEILRQEWSCDYVVSGYGSAAFRQLVDSIRNEEDPSGIKGVSYRKGAQIIRTPPDEKFEYINYRDIPYHLISDYSQYGQLGQKKTIFSLYSAYGCPYKCAFCSSPAQYGQLKKRWVTLPYKEVVDHIKYVVEKYNADYIYFIDDDSFVDLKHVDSIINEIERQKINVKLGFRGARINELKKMSDEFIEKLILAGTDIMHVGVESGSNKMLQLIRKNCTAEEIIEVNKKLARHPKLMVGYNFLIGIPTETMEDLELTRKMMMQLVQDNPSCIIFAPNKFRPIPGTELFDLAVTRYGYKHPDKLEGWVKIEVEGDFRAPWYSENMKEYCDLLLIGSYFIDKKIYKITIGHALFYKFAKIVSRLYLPIINFRFRHGIYKWFIEYKLYKLITKIMVSNYK